MLFPGLRGHGAADELHGGFQLLVREAEVVAGAVARGWDRGSKEQGQG